MTSTNFILVSAAKVPQRSTQLGLVFEWMADRWDDGDVIHIPWADEQVPPLGTTFTLRPNI
jgi:hypothetical protein